MTEPELPEHVARNRVYWDEVNAPLYAASGARAWARQEITWGIFGIPEDQLHALPADVVGMDVVELGCGTAYLPLQVALPLITQAHPERRGDELRGSSAA